MHRLTRSSSRRALVAVAALVLVVALGACGSDDSGGTADASAGSTTTTAGSSDPDYGLPGGGAGAAPGGTIVAVDFSLSDVTVAPGADLVLDNQDGVPHTATADDGAFDLGPVDAGATSDPAAAPDAPGTYGFHCEIHPEMTATLTVEG